MKLLWTETAKQDLIAIRGYIAKDNSAAAKKWVDSLRRTARETAHSPYAGRKVPEFSREDLREFIHGNYRIIYHVTTNHVIIITIFEGHRHFPQENVEKFL